MAKTKLQLTASGLTSAERRALQGIDKTLPKLQRHYMTDDSIRAESKIRTADKQMKSDYDRALSAAGKRDSVNVSKGAAPTTKQQMQLNAMKASITKRVRERGAK